MPAVEYYSGHGSLERRAKAYYYLGRIQENGGNLPEASVSFLKAERFAESGMDDDYFFSLVFQALSNIYSKTHCYEEALQYLKTIGLIEELLTIKTYNYI